MVPKWFSPISKGACTSFLKKVNDCQDYIISAQCRAVSGMALPVLALVELVLVPVLVLRSEFQRDLLRFYVAAAGD